MKTTYVMAIKCYRPDETCDIRQIEVEGDDLKQAFHNAIDVTISAIPFTPSRIEIKPQRHYQKNTAKVVDDDPNYNAAYFRLRSCTGKKAYASVKHAENDAVSVNRKVKPGMPVEYAYPCTFCKLFHVGAFGKNAAAKRLS